MWDKLVEYVVLIALFFAVIGSAYIFIVSIIFRETTFGGFYNSWHFPLLLSIFIDMAYYKHIKRLSTV